MNLLFLTPRFSSGPGGVERHVAILKKELEKRGHRIRELSLEGPGPAEQGMALKSSAWKRLWRNRHLIKHADLIHIHDIFWWYLPFRFLFPRKPVFTTFHGWEGVYPPSKSAIIQKRLSQRLSLGTIGVGCFFKKWYGVTPTLTTFGALEHEVREIGEKVRTQAGVRVKRPNKIKTVAFFGRLEQVNGVDVAIPALRALSKQGVDIQFIGDGSYRGDARKIGPVTGMVKNPWRCLVSSDLVVTSSYLSMLETAAFSKPIVSIATNPLKRDYLMTHPLASSVSIVSSSEELFNTICCFDVSKRRICMTEAQLWAIKQTHRKMADLYERLWEGS